MNSQYLSARTLSIPHISTNWIEEPLLEFGNRNKCSNPKIGISLYGPRSLNTSRHKKEIHISFIGTAESIQKAISFYASCAEGISGDDSHIPFPGVRKECGFRSELVLNNSISEKITRNEIKDVLDIKKSKDRFEYFLQLIESKISLITQKDYPLDYIGIIIPNELYIKVKTAKYTIKGVGLISRDLRRAIKAIAMRYRKPTQLLLDTTIGLIETRRKLDHLSKIAWNLMTGLYFKSDGLPWSPTGLPASSCYIGISFYRPLGSINTLRTSVVQAFDENGDGIILRGHKFYWNYQRSPHLPAELASSLIDLILKKYEIERKQLPTRVIVQKSSKYEEEEIEGFEMALKKINQYDLLTLSPISNIRLIRSGQYPPHRGTSFNIGENSYLYTTGYISERKEYPSGHVPSPLQITEHIGDTSRKQIIKEILTLTKINWNTAEYSGLMPITSKFSELVGEIMKEFSEDSEFEPLTNYKYYM